MTFDQEDQAQSLINAMTENHDRPERDDPLERTKLAIDLMKHVSTLGSGSTLLIAAFLDKFPKPIIAGGLLIGSVISFLCCVALSLYYLIYVGFQDISESGRDDILRRSSVGVVAMLAGWAFFGGIVCLGIFAIRNLHRMH